MKKVNENFHEEQCETFDELLEEVFSSFSKSDIISLLLLAHRIGVFTGISRLVKLLRQKFRRKDRKDKNT